MMWFHMCWHCSLQSRSLSSCCLLLCSTVMPWRCCLLIRYCLFHAVADRRRSCIKSSKHRVRLAHSPPQRWTRPLSQRRLWWPWPRPLQVACWCVYCMTLTSHRGVLAKMTADLEQLHRHLQYHLLEPSGITKATRFPPAPTLPPTLPPSTNFCLFRWVNRVAGVKKQDGP